MAIKKIAILGGGQMGAGIAQVAAQNGVDVVLIKATPGQADAARPGIVSGLARLVEKGKMEQAAADAIVARISFTTDLSDAADVDLFIESIVEDLDVKKAKFAEVDKILKAGAILASNTSTLAIGAMAGATARPGLFLGLHFFNPATMMKLVEVIPTDATDSSATADAIAFVEAIGKTPVLVRDETGFIVNRLLTPYMLDAMRCFESGLADIAGIDTAMQLGANHPMGPLALADYIGLDIVIAMSRNLHESFGEDYMKPTPLLEKLVADGKLGRKTRLGFYDYSAKPPVANPALAKG